MQEWLRNEGLNAWSQVWHATGNDMNGPQLLCLCDCQVKAVLGVPAKEQLTRVCKAETSIDILRPIQPYNPAAVNLPMFHS